MNTEEDPFLTMNFGYLPGGNDLQEPQLQSFAHPSSHINFMPGGMDAAPARYPPAHWPEPTNFTGEVARFQNFTHPSMASDHTSMYVSDSNPNDVLLQHAHGSSLNGNDASSAHYNNPRYRIPLIPAHHSTQGITRESYMGDPIQYSS